MASALGPDVAGGPRRKEISGGSTLQMLPLPKEGLVPGLQPDLVWKKSTRSGSSGNCVEVAATGDLILVRHSKNPSGPALAFTVAEWAAFLAGVRAGEFDSPAPTVG
jgi:hypothetical protein